jgi:hypothetical protein
MRMMILAAAAIGAAMLPASAASAQNWRGYGHNNRGEVRQEVRECRHELRRADSRREYRRELRECRREIARARAGYNDGYYRSGYRYGNRGRYWDGYRWRNRGY